MGHCRASKGKGGWGDPLCLQEEILAPDAMFIVKDLERCTYEIFPCKRSEGAVQ